MESATGKCTRGNLGELFQGTPTESSNYRDRLLYGHSQQPHGHPRSSSLLGWPTR